MPFFYPPQKCARLQIMIWPDSGLILPHLSSFLVIRCSLALSTRSQIICFYLPSPSPSSKASSSRYGCLVKQKPPPVPWGEMEQGWGRCIILSTFYRNGMNWKDCYATEMTFVALNYQVCYCSSIAWCQHLKSSAEDFGWVVNVFKRWFL